MNDVSLWQQANGIKLPSNTSLYGASPKPLREMWLYVNEVTGIFVQDVCYDAVQDRGATLSDSKARRGDESI
jgi:hypothetical protein